MGLMWTPPFRQVRFSDRRSPTAALLPLVTTVCKFHPGWRNMTYFRLSPGNRTTDNP